MGTKKLGAWAASSADPTEVSNRVKGIVLSLSAVIILVAAQFLHIQLTANDVITIATELGAVAGAVWTIYGFGLAFVRWIATIRNPQL